jgi:hypothetical protein
MELSRGNKNVEKFDKEVWKYGPAGRRRGCGFAAQVSAEKIVHDKSIHPSRKDIPGERIR